MSYTPGPWDFCDGEVFTKGGEASVALIQDQDADIAEANACLIAAAPDLLEACKAALEVLEGDADESVIALRVSMKAAIAKAERPTAGLRLP